MTIRARLDRLEKESPQLAKSETMRIQKLAIDEDGRILDDGSEEIQPWIGKHISEWPYEPVGILCGVDPLKILGRAKTKN